MPTTVRLDAETERRLDVLAAQTGRTKAYYIRELIERSLEDVEDYYLAVEVSERIRRGEEKTYAMEEIVRELGLDD